MALVLAHLDPPVAAEVLQLLPLDMQDDIVYRIATLGPVTAEALDDLEALIMRRGTATVAGNAPQRGGTTEAAAIMNNVRKVNEQRIIKQIGKRDKTVRSEEHTSELHTLMRISSHVCCLKKQNNQ